MLIRIISILLSNGIALYGVFYLNWNFFMILYSYWFSEIIASGFERLGYYTIKKRQELSIKQDIPKNDGRFFFLGIYWVFIVIVAGFITAPAEDYGANIRVIFFLNSSFTINILLILIGEFMLYLNTFHINRKYDAMEIAQSLGTLNKRTLVMHLSIIFGTFAWFAMNTDKFFFKIDVGKYGEYGFMIVFIVIRVVGDLMGLRKQTKNNYL